MGIKGYPSAFKGKNTGTLETLEVLKKNTALIKKTNKLLRELNNGKRKRKCRVARPKV